MRCVAGSWVTALCTYDLSPERVKMYDNTNKIMGILGFIVQFPIFFPVLFSGYGVFYVVVVVIGLLFLICAVPDARVLRDAKAHMYDYYVAYKRRSILQTVLYGALIICASIPVILSPIGGDWPYEDMRVSTVVCGSLCVALGAVLMAVALANVKLMRSLVSYMDLRGDGRYNNGVRASEVDITLFLIRHRMYNKRRDPAVEIYEDLAAMKNPQPVIVNGVTFTQEQIQAVGIAAVQGGMNNTFIDQRETGMLEDTTPVGPDIYDTAAAATTEPAGTNIYDLGFDQRAGADADVRDM